MNRIYQSYYTKSDPILKYMTKQLKPERGLHYLEPSAGDGVFISELEPLINDIRIDAFDIDPEAVKRLRGKFGHHSNVNIRESDTLTDSTLELYANSNGRYDRIITNPPYGAWQDYDKRKMLKKIYKGFYVKETYSLFLYLCIKLLKNNGRLVFIIPDTFLNLHMHTRLRKFILENARIIEIALFPSSFFPGINFGYSNLSIMTLERCFDKTNCLSNKLKVLTELERVDCLADNDDNEQEHYFIQEDMLKNVDSALFISKNRQITEFINKTSLRIGDMADCVTGLYSGNDKEFLRVLNDNVRNGKNYQKIRHEQIACLSDSPSLEGIAGKKCFVPIMKGGGIKFVKPDSWFLDWSMNAVNYYKNDKKARFQNSSFYFRTGIGVPMVSSSKITGALIGNRLFDQSIVGIFPKEDKYLYYLLALFNSKVCNELIRTINPTANNSANYIKKIPFVHPSETQLNVINALTDDIVESVRKGNEHRSQKEEKIDMLFQEIYQIEIE